MATEKQWDAVLPVLLIADGTADGVVQVTNTAGFFFGMQALLKNNSSRLTVYIKRVVDKNTLWVGATKGGLDHNVDVSAFTTATTSTISAQEQNKSSVPMEARLQATYETDPINSWRVRPVDPYGNGYTEANPFPVSIDSEITIGEVEVVGPSGHLLDPNSDGSIKTVQIFTLPYDSITATYPTSTQEIYQSRVGGIAGSVVQTATINYTDASKNYILNVART